MRIVYISRNYQQPNAAGSKAKSDIETTLQRLGAVNIGLKRTTSKSTLTHFFRNLGGVIKASMLVRKGDVLVLQYPLKKYFSFCCNIAHSRGAKVITVIHDLNSFRSKRLTPEQERARLDHSDVIIAHNEKMQTLLEGYGLQHPIVQLGIFDYLSPEGIHQDRPSAQLTPVTTQNSKLKTQNSYLSFFFLGNMNPASNCFVYDLAKLLTKNPMHLYGNHLDETRFKEVTSGKEQLIQFHGYANDFGLMAHNEGDFGLSWYGESMEFGKGKIGEYMAINNPHKISLYLRCLCPVILWKNAGLASFIEREGCGLLIDRVDTLEETLSQVTPEQYATMMQNVRRVASNIASGYYFENALKSALSLL